MKTLIINGSPRVAGDTAKLINLISNHSVNKENVFFFNAFQKTIRPCIDCRFCQQKGYCIIKDDFQKVLNDEFDNIILISPVHMGILPAPLIALISRFQSHYCSKRFLNQKIEYKEKKGALILIGGGDGEPSQAIKLASILFSSLNVKNWRNNIITYLDTDENPIAGENIPSHLYNQIMDLVKELQV